MTKLNTNCENKHYFKYLIKMRTIRNKYYENKDHFNHLIKIGPSATKMRTINVFKPISYYDFADYFKCLK